MAQRPDSKKPLSVARTKPVVLRPVPTIVQRVTGLEGLKQVIARAAAASEARRIAREKFKHQAQEAQASDVICGAIRPPLGRSAREREPTVCQREAVRDGKCKEHYLRDVLKISKNGKSPRFRPFWQYQVPLRDMSDEQHRVLKSLPVSMPYHECIERMNKADPASPLEPIAPKT